MKFACIYLIISDVSEKILFYHLYPVHKLFFQRCALIFAVQKTNKP